METCFEMMYTTYSFISHFCKIWSSRVTVSLI